MKIILGNDHAGVLTKQKLLSFLEKKGSVLDLGSTDKNSSDDYVDYAKAVATKIGKSSKGEIGILLCGTGSGMVIAANKIPGARAVAAESEYTAKMARVDNDANILCVRSRYMSLEKQKKIIAAFLSAKFSGKPRHKRRIAKITAMEKSR